MKKILILFVLSLGFSLSINAQETAKQEEVKLEIKAKSYEIAEFVGADDDVAYKIFTILYDRNQEMVKNPGFSEERKIVLSKFVENKIKNTLTEEQFNRLKANNTLYQSILK